MRQALESIDAIEIRMILRNAARIAHTGILRGPWWVLARDIFGVGSASGAEICRKAGLDPDQPVRDGMR